MPWNILIFPLVGGYFFLTTSSAYKYKYIRIESQRLVLNSAIAGSIFFFISFMLCRLPFIDICDQLVGIDAYMQKKLGFDYLGSSILSLVIAVLITKITNPYLNINKYNYQSIAENGNSLEQLIASSFQEFGVNSVYFKK